MEHATEHGRPLETDKEKHYLHYLQFTLQEITFSQEKIQSVWADFIHFLTCDPIQVACPKTGSFTDLINFIYF